MRRALGGKRSIATRDLVAFDVGGVAYAVDIRRVREIMRPRPVTVLPHLPAGVVGVVDHRGDVVPIVDLRARFGIGKRETERDVRWVVVTRGERLLGLVVDRVATVLHSEEAALRESPALGAGQAERGIVGARVYEGRLLFLLDVDRVAAVVDEVALPASAAALPRSVDERR